MEFWEKVSTGGTFVCAQGLALALGDCWRVFDEII